MFPARLKNKELPEDYYNSLTERLELTERFDHMPGELSGGQQQRVAIARALINKPAVVLCDEPTGNLDQKNSTEVVRLLKELQEEYKLKIIIVTHDNCVAEVADMAVRLEDGKIV